MTDEIHRERDLFLQQFPVPRETAEKLDAFSRMLMEWSEKFNLVAASTLPHIWQRHILDSAQLMAHIPPTAQQLADMGSGAGFPGLVLAIMGVPEVHLIESTGKKADFLRAVSAELGLRVAVHQERVEALRGLKADVVTARALKALPELLSLAAHLTRKQSVCLFLKGQKVDAELTEARKYWTFSSEKVPSLSDPSGSVLKISDLKALSQHERRKSRHRR